MPLTSGTQLGHYQIQSLIGKGGMGEVYRAVDTKLEREVAIKVLPAALNHPNIAAIYGPEDRAIVMELVEGPTPAERIRPGAPFAPSLVRG